ncbi:hypothetical protein Poli38472_008885 [Pythium oligandrum]|uniref:Uncharacterized protein n=1 Tax=Pythium oligandrum TaxID=41045 RepID=A0A8K1FE40_PYTOL|nr:hypothetical protein Poli38472_008885 [Pythium oligandrum]|eukprot:TMW56237.1 hypothetical protein Poli38472_008885 [Pythium oligandrum]
MDAPMTEDMAPATPDLSTPSKRRLSSRPPTTPLTPASVRAHEERLLRRGREIATEYSQRRKKRFSFNPLPDAGPRTPTDGSPREESPARYSLGQVTEAVMSFADFLYFLEEKQREHPLMPVIAERFAELGAVIESQKRHIDRWKQAELDVAISEQQQNLDIIRELGMKIEKLDMKLANSTVEKQRWEEKYEKSAQEAKEIIGRAEESMRRMNAQIAELQYQNMDLENAMRERNEMVANHEKDNAELQKMLEQMEMERVQLTQENRNLVEQRAQHEQITKGLQEQIQQLQQMCEAERQKGDGFGNAAHAWEIKHQEEKRLREHLEKELELARQDREQNSSQMKQLVGQSGMFRAEFEVITNKYEQQLQAHRDTIRALEMEKVELAHKLEAESEKVRQSVKDLNVLRNQADRDVGAMRAEMEQLFTTQANRLREELGEETKRVREENEELARQAENLRAISNNKSTQLAELMANRQNVEGQGAQHIQELSASLAEWQAKCEQLQRDLREKERAAAEALKKQGDEMEAQFNAHLQDVQKFVEKKSAETEELRGALKAREEDILKLQKAAMEEVTKWQKECEEYAGRASALDFDGSALRREVEHCKKELEMREKEIESLKGQIAAYLAPDNERSKQTELLQRERLRLEDQNRDLRHQLDSIKKEAEQKLEELNQNQMRVMEEASAQRATVVSLHHEKDDLQRALGEITAEKTAMESHMRRITEEREVLLETVSQRERQVAELESKGKQLLETLKNAEQEKAELDGKVHKLSQEARVQIQAASQQDLRPQLEKINAQLKNRDEELIQLRREAKSYYESAQENEEKNSRLTTELQRQDDEMSKIRRDLATSRETIQRAEIKCKQLIAELETAKSWSERYKTELETLRLKGNQQLDAQQNEYARQCQELTGECGRLKGELEGVKYEAEREVQRLRNTIEGREAEFRQEHKRLTDENNALRLQVQEAKEAIHKLQTEFKHVSDQLQNRIAALREAENMAEEARLEKNNTRSALIDAQSQLQRTENALEDFKRQTMRNVKEKKDMIDKLDEENRDLRSKLSKQADLKENLMQRAQTEKNSLNAELLQKEQKVSEAQFTIRQLEDEVASLQRRINTYHDTKSSAEASQSKALLQEMKEMEKQLESVQKERDELRRSISHATDEIAALKRDLNSEREETSRVRADLTQVKSEMSPRMNSVERELHQAQTNLVSERERVRVLKETIKQKRTEFQTAIDNKNEEIEALRKRIKNFDLGRDHQDLRQTHYTERLEAFQQNEANLLKRLKSLQKRYDEEVTRNSELQNKLDRALDDRSSAKGDVVSELRRVGVNFDSKSVQENVLELHRQLQAAQTLSREKEALIDHKDALIRELKADLRKATQYLRKSQSEVRGDHKDVTAGSSYIREGARELRTQLQQAESRSREQSALVQHKESQIREKEASLLRKETEIRGLEAEIRRLQQLLKRKDAEKADGPSVDSLQQELDRMSHKMSEMNMDNQRESEREKAKVSSWAQKDLEDRCAKLERQIRMLREENKALRLHQDPSEDHSACTKQIERLMTELKKKERDVVALRESQGEKPRSSTSSSRRVRDLEKQLKEKEVKLMVLNDHLTYHMARSIQLQAVNEKYVLDAQASAP